VQSRGWRCAPFNEITAALGLQQDEEHPESVDNNNDNNTSDEKEKDDRKKELLAIILPSTLVPISFVAVASYITQNSELKD
jgi:hypothetical protein